MAARSQMLQQRRQIQMQNGQLHPRIWSDTDDRPIVYIPVEEEEDPLESFVRFISDKSKSLWKRVTSKAKQSDEDETTGIAREANVVEGEEGGAVRSQIPAAEARGGGINVGGPSSQPSEENFQKIEWPTFGIPL
jgi:hypothetical protein